MNSYLKLVSRTVILLGAVLIGLGLFCYLYYETHGWLIPYTVFPFRHYAMPLTITGVILLVTGYSLYSYQTETEVGKQ